MYKFISETELFWICTIPTFLYSNTCTYTPHRTIHFDYSGGNKRKLSTAISLIGNPSVIFMVS
jgi:hypothetical protein